MAVLILVFCSLSPLYEIKTGKSEHSIRCDVLAVVVVMLSLVISKARVYS